MKDLIFFWRILLKTFLLKLFSFSACFAALLPLQAQMDTDAYGDFSYYDPCKVCKNQFWLEADYLYWHVQDSPKIIPLVIEQSVEEGPFSVVLGGKKVKNDWHSGARFAVGYLFDACESLGVEINYFFLGGTSKHSSVAADANGSPPLRVPYFNVSTGLPDSSPLATPGVFTGSASLNLSNKMQGAELNIIKEMPSDDCTSLKVFAGFRYWNFNDNVKFSAASPLVVIPTVYNYQDTFRTQNNFYGGQMGAMYRQNVSCLFFDVKGKLAMGAMCQKSAIKGYFQTNEFTGSVQTFEGGFFALPTNIGDHKKTRFSVIPELNVNFGYPITDDVCLRLGYSVIYVSGVLRAGKQISSSLNPTQSANIEFTPAPVLVGQASPKGRLRSSGLWVQGLNASLDYAF